VWVTLIVLLCLDHQFEARLETKELLEGALSVLMEHLGGFDSNAAGSSTSNFAKALWISSNFFQYDHDCGRPRCLGVFNSLLDL
jgi:hypothetical protein